MKRRRAQASSTILVTLVALTALSMLAAFAVSRVVPRLRMAYQNAAWEEARLAAEAGVDAAMSDLIANTQMPTGGNWTGWKMDGPDGRPVAAQNGGPIGGLLTGTVSLVTGLLTGLLGGGGSTPPPSNTVTVSAPIYLDNLRVSGTSGIPTEVDVQLWALQQPSSSHVYFRIRSMATCALPPAAYAAQEKNDAALRRLSLRKIRPSLRKDDVGEPIEIKLPNVSRTVEVLVEPIMPFELAAWTQGPISLGSTGAWCVDSFDSRDLQKSSFDGTYPGVSSPKVRENGHVASNFARSAAAPYGPIVAANGARVRGSVATNGGDDPASGEHENVTGGMALQPDRIRDDFCREMRPVTRPSGAPAPAPPEGDPFHAGTESAPSMYLVPGDLRSFQVTPQSGFTRGFLIILVDGDLNLDAPLTIPPTVTVQIFVRGHVRLYSAANATAFSSHRAGKLQIFGEAVTGVQQTLRAYGSIQVCAVFYGPSYAVSLDGNVNWTGALVAESLEIIGGGSGGIHYDEALATLGGPTSFRIARYVEDVRE